MTSSGWRAAAPHSCCARSKLRAIFGLASVSGRRVSDWITSCRKNHVGTKGTPLAQISVDEVATAFRYILGREPANDDVVQALAKHSATIADVRRALISSEEFRQSAALAPPLPGAPRVASAPLLAPRMVVDIDATPEQLRMMYDHIEATWLALGEEMPHWSVLTHEIYKADSIEENIEGFYASGETDCANLLAAVGRGGASLDGLRTCFELGCGVGRVTIWLAKLFDEVVASDISRAHLDIAENAAARRNIQNVKTLLLNRIDRYDHLPAFDFFYSVMVLQHNPPPVMAIMLRRILDRLNPGGLAYFQIPTYSNHPFRIESYPKSRGPESNMEMHALPQAALWGIAEEANCRLLDVREDRNNIAGWVSNAVLLQKRA